MRLIRPYPICRLPAAPREASLRPPLPSLAKPVRVVARPQRPNEGSA